MTRRNLVVLTHTARALAFHTLAVVIDGIIRVQKMVRG